MMTPPTFLYIKIYQDTDNRIHVYTGITKDMKSRQSQHERGLTRTTRKFNKSYQLKEVRYASIGDSSYEKTFKKYAVPKKLKLSDNWKRWAG